jgi:hypothetical protein
VSHQGKQTWGVYAGNGQIAAVPAYCLCIALLRMYLPEYEKRESRQLNPGIRWVYDHTRIHAGHTEEDPYADLR